MDGGIVEIRPTNFDLFFFTNCYAELIKSKIQFDSLTKF